VLDQVSPLFALPSVSAQRMPDGAIILKSRVPLQGADRCIGDWLEKWARQTPDVTFLAERASVDAPWTTVTYGEALRKVRGAAAWIIAQDLSAQRPLAILSDNSIDHALFSLAAMHAGVPVEPDVKRNFAMVSGVIAANAVSTASPGRAAATTAKGNASVLCASPVTITAVCSGAIAASAAANCVVLAT
jgi:feruloyl-CoA synthase